MYVLLTESSNLCKAVGSSRMCESREKLPLAIVTRRQPISRGLQSAPRKSRSRRRRSHRLARRVVSIDRLYSQRGTLVSSPAGIWRFDKLDHGGTEIPRHPSLSFFCRLYFSSRNIHTFVSFGLK